ncbi:hypothetical protein ACE193_05645 [Bernardetia sp. OM2101]|uniref:hypothetical protein n=1 Tax=Bernardetia sp. OM2101 TaxID=3344876 RepID=UPI0035D105C5
MIPSLFLYKKIEDKYLFYVLELSTLDGLKLLPQELESDITDFGATEYKQFGWATQNDIPKLSTVKDVVRFLENEQELGLINFEVIIKNYGKLSSHDDGECHFELDSKLELISIFKKILPFPHQNKLLAHLLKYQNQYLKVDEIGNIIHYPTFDDYLKARRNEY